MEHIKEIDIWQSTGDLKLRPLRHLASSSEEGPKIFVSLKSWTKNVNEIQIEDQYLDFHSVIKLFFLHAMTFGAEHVFTTIFLNSVHRPTS